MVELDGPVYFPVPEGADWLTRLSWELEHASVRTEGAIHFLFLLAPPAWIFGCVGVGHLLRERRPRLAALARAAAILGPLYMLRPFFYSTWVLAPWQFGILGAPFVLWALRFRRPEPRKRLYRAGVAFALILAFVPFLNIAASFNRVHDCDRLRAEPRVRRVFSYCDPGRLQILSEMLGQPVDRVLHYAPARLMFASSDGSTLYLGGGFEDEPQLFPFLIVDEESGEIVSRQTRQVSFQGTCLAATRRCYTVQPYQAAIHVLDEVTNEWVEAIRMPFKPRFFGFDPEGTKLYFAGASGVQFAIFDAATGAIEDHSIVAPLRPPPSSVAYDPVRDRVFHAGELHSRGFFKVADGPDWKFGPVPVTYHRYLETMGTSVGVEIDPARREVYVGMTFTGEVEVFDADTLASLAIVELEPGLREMALDRERRRLYVGNYLTGELHVVDLEARAEVDRIFVGRITRSVQYSPALDRVLVSSANGFLEVDPFGPRDAGPVRAAPSPPAPEAGEPDVAAAAPEDVRAEPRADVEAQAPAVESQPDVPDVPDASGLTDPPVASTAAPSAAAGGKVVPAPAVPGSSSDAR